jgi:hypothetical protein
VVERSYEPDDQAMFFSEKPRPSELVRKAVADRPGHTLAQLANVGQGQGIMPLSGPNASIHAARSADTDLLGQTQTESSSSANQAASPLNSRTVGISSNSANQFASPAAAPRQLSISPLPPPSPNLNRSASSQRQELTEEPIPTPAPREELSFFSKAVQEPKKEEAIKPTEREKIGETVEPKVEAAKEAVTKEAEHIPLPNKVEMKTELKPEIQAELRPETKPEIKVTAEAEPELKTVEKVSATAAAIASQATTQTLSNAGVNSEKSTYHFVARPEEDELQKIDLNTDKDIAENNRRVAHAIKNLFDSVDTSISALTAVGVDAMKADDIAAVSSIMRQTKTLKVLRDGIVQLSKDWQKSLEN